MIRKVFHTTIWPLAKPDGASRGRLKNKSRRKSLFEFWHSLGFPGKRGDTKVAQFLRVGTNHWAARTPSVNGFKGYNLNESLWWIRTSSVGVLKGRDNRRGKKRLKERERERERLEKDTRWIDFYNAKWEVSSVTVDWTVKKDKEKGQGV